jgi:MFS family permease
MVVLDATIVNIALPHIQSALNFSTTSLSWVLNAYTLTFGGLLLLGGRAGDILGRRRVFITGILVFSRCSAGWRPPPAGCWPPGRCRASVARSPRRRRWR